MSTRARATSMRAVRHGAARRRSAIATAVQQLQAAGRRGVLPPPQDISRGMFWRDRARTQPYTEADKERTVEFVDDLAGNPVGWQLGADLVANGTFAANLSGWSLSQTVGATLPAWSAGRMLLVSDGSGFSRADQQLTTIPNRNYRLWVFVVTPGSGSCDVRLGTTQGASDILSAQSITATGWQSYPFVPTTSSTWIRFSTGSNNATGYLIDTVVAKEVILDESWMGPNIAGNTLALDQAPWETLGTLSSVTANGFTNSSGAGAGRRIVTGIANGRCYQYEVQWTKSDATTELSISFISGVAIAASTAASGTFSGIAPAGTQCYLRLAGNATVTFSVVKIREIPGHPIVSAVAGSGLVLSRRVNLLQRTEDLTAGPWTNASGTGLSATVSNVPSVSPMGTAATRIQMSLGGGTSTTDIIRRSQPLTPSVVPHRFSIWIRSFDGSSTYNMHLVGASALTTNIVVTGTWTRFEVVAVGTGSIVNIGVGLRGGQTPANSNSADVLVWGSDLRPTFWDQFPGIPSYQRVNDGTAGVLDYDDSPAFPLHWRNVTGTQAMMTLGTVDMSAGDAGAIIAALIKTSDAAAAVVADLTAAPNTTAGSLTLLAPTSAAPSVGFFSRGSTQVGASNNATAAPALLALVGQSDISDDFCRLFSSGAQIASSSADQGAGTLANARFYIAARSADSGAQFRFTGILLHLPVLVAADAGVDLQALAREYAASAGFIY